MFKIHKPGLAKVNYGDTDPGSKGEVILQFAVVDLATFAWKLSN